MAKPKEPEFTNGQKPGETLLQRGHTDGREAFEETLRATRRRGNADDSHSNTPLSARQTSRVCGEAVARRGPSDTAAGHAGWCSHCGDVGRFLQGREPELPCNPAVPLLGVCPQELKPGPPGGVRRRADRSEDVRATLVSARR